MRKGHNLGKRKAKQITALGCGEGHLYTQATVNMKARERRAGSSICVMGMQATVTMPKHHQNRRQETTARTWLNQATTKKKTPKTRKLTKRSRPTRTATREQERSEQKETTTTTTATHNEHKSPHVEFPTPKTSRITKLAAEQRWQTRPRWQPCFPLAVTLPPAQASSLPMTRFLSVSLWAPQGTQGHSRRYQCL